MFVIASGGCGNLGVGPYHGRGVLQPSKPRRDRQPRLRHGSLSTITQPVICRPTDGRIRPRGRCAVPEEVHRGVRGNIPRREPVSDQGRQKESTESQTDFREISTVCTHERKL